MRTRELAQQHLRQNCPVGDFVLASSVPEWTTDRVKQTFTPPSPVNASIFSSSAARVPEKWTFMGSYFLDPAGEPVAIWRRET
ncbi:hypothetical protein [Luteolibacter soli]|uniref:Uncharacterized protein n=1 Tax=Luteolibacter soli TaxID=3135280 RepID=A0ABU9B2V2_9BACT